MWETHTQNYNHKPAKLLTVVLFEVCNFYIKKSICFIYISNLCKWDNKNENEVMSAGNNNNEKLEHFASGWNYHATVI